MREPVRQTMQRYARQRLREECKEFGAAARIARELGFAKPTISIVLNTDRGPGDDLMRALATHWGLTFAQLEEEALAWAAKQPATGAASQERAGGGGVSLPLAEYPEWADQLAVARQHYRSIPEEHFAAAGRVIVPGRRPTWELIGRIAQLLWDTETFLASGGEDDAATHRRQIARRRPPSGTISTLPPGPRDGRKRKDS